MIQLREHALLAEEALAARCRYPGIAQNFDSHQIAEVLAFGKIDSAHSAFAQFSQDLVRAELQVRKRRRRIVQQIMRDVGNVAFEKRSAAGVLGEQCFHFGQERGIFAAGGLQKWMLLGRGKIQRSMKEGLDSFPARAVHVSMRLAQLVSEPSFGRAPVTENGGFGDLQQRRGFGYIQTAEETAFHHHGLPWIHARQFFQRRIEGEQFLAALRVVSVASSKVTMMRPNPPPRLWEWRRRAASTST